MSSTGDSARAGSMMAVEDRDLPTVAPVVVEVKPPPPTMPLEEVLLHEHQMHMPDGPGAMVEERRTLPWVIGGLATTGLIVGALIIGATVNWTAALVGIIWLLMGYAVAWSVVWGAGLMRAGDEIEAEAMVNRGESPPPACRVG